MSIQNIGSTWKTDLESGIATDRLYIDFEKHEYAPQSGDTIEYWKNERGISGSENAHPMQSGSFNGLFFNAGTNLVTDPEDTSTANWTDNATTSTAQTKYVQNKKLTLVTEAGGGINANVYQVVAVATATPSFQGILKKYVTANDNTQLRLYESTGGVSRGTIVVNFVTQAVSVANGAADLKYYWIDDVTVWVSAVAAAVNPANVNEIRVYPDAGGGNTESIYCTAIQVEDNAWPTPYMGASRAQIENKYLIDLPSTFSMRIIFQPWFNFDTSANQVVLSWYVDATHLFTIFYRQSTDKFSVFWVDGGTLRSLDSNQYDDGSSFVNIKNPIVMDLAIDLTTGDTTGSQLWTGRTSRDTAWGGNSDVKALNFPSLTIGHENNLEEGDIEINQIIFIPNKIITDADVQNDFEDIKDQQIIWNFNGEATAKTWCDVTRHTRDSITRDVEARKLETGSQSANRAGFTLNNAVSGNQGIFTDNIYAAYSPAADQFNGTSAQAYLQEKCSVMFENWFGNYRELVFLGEIDEARFTRSTDSNNFSVVRISCEDMVNRIAKKILSKATAYTDKPLVNGADEADSLFHLVTRLGSQGEITNFASNSGFENATITNSWETTTALATWQIDAAERLIGTNSGEFIYHLATGGTQVVRQLISFQGDRKLNVGETFSFSVYMSSASSFTFTVGINEIEIGVGAGGGTSSAVAYTANTGWTKFSVSHTVGVPASDELEIYCSVAADVTYNIDCVQLTSSKRALDVWALNDDDGASATYTADAAVASGPNYTWDRIGIDSIVAKIPDSGGTDSEIPYYVVSENTSPWGYMKEIADAVGAHIMGIDSNGTIKIRGQLEDGFSSDNETAIATIDSITGISSIFEPATANKIIGHGVKYIVNTEEDLVWSIGTSGAYKVTGTLINEAVANGATFPETDKQPFWAIYGEI